MKTLVVHSGASWSTHDVWRGYVDALEAAGVQVIDYRLDARIERAHATLQSLHRAYRRRGRTDMPRPTPADTLYLACEGLLAMAVRHQVDFVLIISGMYVHPDWLALLRQDGWPVGILLTESPYEDEEQARVLRYCVAAWTNERSSVPILQWAANQSPVPAAVGYLPAAYDPARHHPTGDGPADTPAHEVVLVGTGFEERIELLERVDWSGIDLGLYGTWPVGRRSPLRPFVHEGSVPNARTVAMYRRAKIGLNLHRQSIVFGRGAPRILHAESANPRVYELAACATFQVSDYRAELTERFGESLPTFRTAEELQGLLHRYLHAPDADAERARLRAAQHRAVQGQTFAARVDSLLEDVSRIMQTHAERNKLLAGVG